MFLFFSFFSFFGSLALLSSILVIGSRNPVYSVLFLILCFANVSALLFLLGLEFLPVTFIVVYVGAIAVLFLFVLMMLNIKLTELKSENISFVSIAILLSSVFILEVFALTRLEFLPLTAAFSENSFLLGFSNYNIILVSSSIFDTSASNIRALGMLLFTDFYLQFILVGYVLLFAMVGAIALTLHKKFLSRTQSVYFQVLRNFNACVTFSN